MIITARTTGRPLTHDGFEIVGTHPGPVSSYEFRSSNDGHDTQVLRRSTADTAGRPTRAALEDQNAAGLKRVVAAAGGAR